MTNRDRDRPLAAKKKPFEEREFAFGDAHGTLEKLAPPPERQAGKIVGGATMHLKDVAVLTLAPWAHHLIIHGDCVKSVEAPAGIVTFALDNQGAENHELAFLPGGGEVPFTDGAPDEAALEDAGAFELEAFSSGQTCNATYDLEPGEYTLFCIIETADGETHYELGMQGTLTVS